VSTLYIDGINAPLEIKKALRALSKNIAFSKEDIKATNGHVFFGTNRITEKNVAVKFCYWGGKAEFHAEPNQLAQIEADNVLKIQDAALLDNKWAYFVTPNCVNGDLDALLEITSLGNLAAIDYTYQILSGLSHLHAKRFLHRDIKPANIYISDDDKAVIGDFGSVKKIPEGASSIPASSHSLLYRPPESITNNSYGIMGDIYQVGIVLYQLAGGVLPYDGREWLSRRELEHYESIALSHDQSDFVDQCVRSRIVSGRVLNISSLPPWVPSTLKRLIRKACHVDSAQRFANSSSFMAKLHELRPSILDWRVVDGSPVLFGNTSYRIIERQNTLGVQKRTTTDWRNDNGFAGKTIEELVDEISEMA
jgi:eukaryotic-like serine/threonine-protein kinase